ncbi:DUF3226 domain-containing protein [Allofournierella sp.]|uniref:DUF3226 domain-containing protein n=1 Tax=Allofournierella TaxID=1940255 RepID=UPI00307980BB
MNKLILCEGKTDAILLSYYLDRVHHWTPCKKGPKEVRISADEISGESAYWYQREEDRLLICGVGGKDKFGSFFKNKIEPAIIDAHAFSKVALVTDRDDRKEEDVTSEVYRHFERVITRVEQNRWVSNLYQDSFGQQQNLSFLLLIIPTDQQGALESLLLEAISEDPYDREIVTRSNAFVAEIAPHADRYIGHARLKLKARLGVTWAIQSPGKEFSFIDTQIRSVKWEQSQVLANCFSQLVLI